MQSGAGRSMMLVAGDSGGRFAIAVPLHRNGLHAAQRHGRAMSIVRRDTVSAPRYPLESSCENVVFTLVSISASGDEFEHFCGVADAASRRRRLGFELQ